MELVEINAKIQLVETKLKQRMFSTSQQQSFLEDMAALIEDGATPKQAAEIIKNVGKSGPAGVADAILHSISQGRPMAQGMQGWFPVHIIELVRSGEIGGTLAKVLQSAAEILTKKSGAIAALMGAITYPFIVLALAFGVTVFINHSVFASFKAITPVSQWPASGQTLVGIAEFLQSYWWSIALIVFGVSYLLGLLLKNYIGEYRYYIDRIPGLSLYRRSASARFMETLGILIANGVIFKQALKIMSFNANAYIGAHLIQMERRLSTGKDNIADVIDTGLLNKDDLFRLRVIGKGKGFEHALIRQGRRAAEADLKALQRLGKIIGNLMLISGGLYAAFVVTTIYEIGSSMGVAA